MNAGRSGVVGVALLVLFPDFVPSPLAEVDPRLDPIFLGAVAELQPTFPTDSYTFGRFLFLLGPALSAVPYVSSIAWRRRDDADGARWAFVAVVLVSYIVMALRYLRFVPFAEAPRRRCDRHRCDGPRRARLARHLPRIPARAGVSAAATVGLIVGIHRRRRCDRRACIDRPAAGGAAPRSCDLGAVARL